MRSWALLISLVAFLGVSRGAAAREPEPQVESARVPEIPPEKIGTGLLTWGSLGVIIGSGTVGSGLYMWIAYYGRGGNLLGLFPAIMGASWVALGGVGIHFGDRRRDAHRSWRSRNHGRDHVG